MRTTSLSVATVAAVVGAVLLPVGAASGAESVTASQLPSLLRVAAETTAPAYDRSMFEHWIDADDDGCNTRYEVLIAASTTPVTVGSGCALTGGTWVSAMDGAIATSPAGIEIDHVVALAEAWRSGASAWTGQQRREYANDLGVSYALQPASTASNQSKSDKDPAEWMPSNAAFRCEYVTSWALVKYRWSLAVDQAERDALVAALSGSCGQTRIELPAVMLARAESGSSSQPSGSSPSAQPETSAQSAASAVREFTEPRTRLAGADRYATAIEISRRYSAGVPALFVSTGTNFPDALSAASAAAALGGPLLLTTPTSLPASVRARITELAPDRIYIVGGVNAVSDAVRKDLREIAPTTRLGGATRYDTALDIVDAAFTTGSDEAFIATGSNFPDALGATGAAGSRRAPLILVDGASQRLSDRALAKLRALGVKRVTIAGGPVVISQGIEAQLRSLGYSVVRYGGADRYETTALINSAFFASGSTTVFVATGTNFPDALAGAALAGQMRAPLYTTTTACVPVGTRDSITAVGAAHTAVLGGPVAVSEDAAANLACLKVGVPTITGTPRAGNQLTAGPGVWSPGTALSYRWYANGSPIAGATGAALTLGAAHVGTSITVQVSGSQTGFVGAAAWSSGVGPVSAAAAPPTIPARPADVDCSDFGSQAAAQRWFDTYYPHYGDVARLDGDGDRIACESLP